METRLANLALQRGSRGVGGGLVASLTGHPPRWVGSNQHNKRVDVLGMRKKVELGATRV